MQKILTALLMAALVAGVTAGAGSAPAQDKKDVKKADPKADPKVDSKTPAPKAGGTVKISEGKDGKFRFSIYDADGSFQAMSGANTFDSKEAAVKGLDALKAALTGAKIEFAKGDKK